MTTSSAFATGDVISLEFPFSDGTAGKDRPALVIAGPSVHGDYCLAMVSGERQDDGIPISRSDLAAGNLSKASFVRVRRLYTFKSSLFTAKRATLKPAAMQRVMSALCPALGCKA